jgi:hypothetical protein
MELGVGGSFQLPFCLWREFAQEFFTIQRESFDFSNAYSRVKLRK